jgi:hypothetical protein
MFFEAKSRSELKRKVDIRQFACVVKVDGGFMCFKTLDEYET